jgi:hypothetical protein
VDQEEDLEKAGKSWETGLTERVAELTKNEPEAIALAVARSVKNNPIYKDEWNFLPQMWI